ncbi:MAG: RNA polymerase-binding protein DksA [Deltaproteobacteria bacterium]|nr:RNA polymerase-binding protein DksA [Deltaproteobacteria bacterium]
MNETQLQEFRDLLNRQMEDLINEAGKTVNEMTDQKAAFPDPTDRASMESDRNFELRIRERERKLIGKIREALDRIEHGEFGICESCGEEIGLERLRVRPVTTLCIDCKEEEEQREKLGSFK